MIILQNGRAMPVDVADELARLEQLVVDLKHIAAGHVPDPRNISMAPIIDKWAVAARPVPSLIGIVSGHPCIKDRRVSMTAPVVLLSPEMGWARTMSNLYRLGFPVGDRPTKPN